MPPWSGTDEEADALVSYLQTITPPHPMRDPEGLRASGGETLTTARVAATNGAGR